MDHAKGGQTFDPDSGASWIKDLFGAEAYEIVLGKFGLVQFEPYFAKSETKPFGFSQNLSNQN